MTVTLDYPGLVLPHQQGGGASVPVTITSDDEGPVRIGWEDAEMRVDESAGTVTLRAFAVTTQDAAPSAGYTLRTTVTTIAGTAVRSSSYTPVTRRITLGASDFTQATVEGQPRYRAGVEVTLTITDDSDDEPDEELSVVLAPAGASPPGPRRFAGRRAGDHHGQRPRSRGAELVCRFAHRGRGRRHAGAHGPGHHYRGQGPRERVHRPPDSRHRRRHGDAVRGLHAAVRELQLQHGPLHPGDRRGPAALPRRQGHPGDRACGHDRRAGRDLHRDPGLWSLGLAPDGVQRRRQRHPDGQQPGRGDPRVG